MADTNQTEKTTAVVTGGPSKSFMTAGPTLHYSHDNVHRFWGLTVAVFILACYFWNRILTGGPISVNLMELADTSLFSFGRFIVYPVSIYEYPWQIIILGMLMGILTMTPMLVSQLLSFRYSIPLLLSVFFIAKLYLFGIFLLISCIAVACRPLRFRSRFISVALCMAPQIAYWAIWGGYPTVDPVRWGFSFAPWIYSWLSGLFIAGVVLGIGHFTRYKPGLIWLVSFIVLATSFFIFQNNIGFSELDYQLYVAGNDPEDSVEFHDHDLSVNLDEVIKDDALRSSLMGLFYPTEPILLREKLKDKIKSLIVLDRWPEWFIKKLPEPLKYPAKNRRDLMNQYEVFMERWPNSKRMPIALYFRAILQEYAPDLRYFESEEILRYYSDYPFPDNSLAWQELFEKFPLSPESLEARWRIAMHTAGRGDFDKAAELCQVSLVMLHEEYEKQKADEPTTIEADSIFTAFQEPAATVMTLFKLQNLEMRFKKLQVLIGQENRSPDEKANQRLAKFVLLNPYSLDYESRLDALLIEMPQDDPLRDNILLKKIMLIKDIIQQSQKLSELSQTYPGTDAGKRALYELGLVKVQHWKNPQSSPELKTQLLAEARTILTDFIQKYPDSIYAAQAESVLKSLPQP